MLRAGDNPDLFGCIRSSKKLLRHLHWDNLVRIAMNEKYRSPRNPVDITQGAHASIKEEWCEGVTRPGEDMPGQDILCHAAIGGKRGFDDRCLHERFLGSHHDGYGASQRLTENNDATSRISSMFVR